MGLAVAISSDYWEQLSLRDKLVTKINYSVFDKVVCIQSSWEQVCGLVHRGPEMNTKFIIHWHKSSLNVKKKWISKHLTAKFGLVIKVYISTGQEEIKKRTMLKHTCILLRVSAVSTGGTIFMVCPSQELQISSSSWPLSECLVIRRKASYATSSQSLEQSIPAAAFSNCKITAFPLDRLSSTNTCRFSRVGIMTYSKRT